MKKLLATIIIFLLLSSPATAQMIVFLPVILKAQSAMNNSWQLVKPIGSTNYVLNPSAETTSNFANVGAATVTRSTTYQKYGLNSYRVQTTAAGNGQGVTLTLTALTNTEHFATARIRNPGTRLRFTIGSAAKEVRLLERIDAEWALYGVSFGASQANGQTALQITQLGPGAKDFYIDGIQVEPLGYWTTYIDGTQEGCIWNGIAHASISTRSDQSRAGGRVRDFYKDYGFFVERIVGAGVTGIRVGVDSYALLPGGELNSIKIDPREFTIIGKFIADSEEQLHEKRQALVSELSADSYPDNQPVRLRFAGGRVQKEISVFYKGGLEGDLAAFYGDFEPGDESWTKLAHFTEKASIQLVAPDPFWYEVGESAVSLDTNDSGTFRMVAGRLKSTGQWSMLGPPNVAGTYTQMEVIAEDTTYVYIGGFFLNFDNIANADGIVRYNKLTGVYSAMGTGVNAGGVNSLAIGPDGSVYAGGTFTLMGGVANTVYIARWDGSAWNALGTGMNLTVRDLVVGLSGDLYATGEFTLAGGVANTVRIARWDGSAWNALGTGLSSIGRSLAVGPDGSIYVGGDFTTANGVTVNGITYWNGSTFVAMGGGISGSSDTVLAIVVSGDNTVYIAGSFNTAGGVSIPNLARWNGAAWVGLGSGLNDDGYTLALGADGILYIGGIFTSAGGQTLADRMARWNGYLFTHLDIDLPGSPVVQAIFASKFADPVVEQKYDLFIGSTTTGTANFAGKVAALNGGNAPAFPKIVYSRLGGTTAIIETLRNERNGQELLFNYSLLNGEELVIDLKPTKKSIISSSFGSRLDAVLPSSDFGDWVLLPGSNDVTSFVATTGSPTVTAFMTWRDAFKSYD